MISIIIYMVRHGQTNYNKKRIMQGKSNVLLNEYGVKEAYNAREKLKDISFDICISSPLKRALQTAEIIIDNKCKIIFDDLLVERNMGNFEGKPYELCQKYDFWNLKINLNYNGVEPVKSVFLRSKDFLDKIKNKYKNKTILIVSHHAVLRALHYNIVGYNYDTNLLDFHPLNGKIYKYEI